MVYEDIIWFALHNVASVSHNHDVAIALHFALALRAMAFDGVPGEEVLVAGIALGTTRVVLHLGKVLSRYAYYPLAGVATELVVLASHKGVESLWFCPNFITTLLAFVRFK